MVEQLLVELLLENWAGMDWRLVVVLRAMVNHKGRKVYESTMFENRKGVCSVNSMDCDLVASNNNCIAGKLGKGWGRGWRFV